MNEKTWLRIVIPFSGNLKSAIQNLKLVGLLAIALTFTFGGAVVDAQQTGKVFRIGFLDGSTASANAGLVEVFRQELKQAWMD
jgi:hypothetical protein